MNMKRSLMILAAVIPMLLCGMPSVAAQKTDSLKLKLYFKQNMSNLDLDYHDNERNFDIFVSEVKKIVADPFCRVQDIIIRSGASPEGKFDNNKALSRRRGESIRDFLSRSLPIPDINFRVDAVGEDWAAFREMVEQNNYPDREKILDILYRHTDYINGRPRSVIGGPKKELMDLNGGKTWFWLLKYVFPDLRSADNNVILRYTRVQDPEPEPEPDPEPEPAPAQERQADTMVIIHKYIFEYDTIPGEENPFQMQIKTAASREMTDTSRVRVIDAVADSSFRAKLGSGRFLDATFSPDIDLKIPDGKDADISIDSKVVIPDNNSVIIKKEKDSKSK